MCCKSGCTPQGTAPRQRDPGRVRGQMCAYDTQLFYMAGDDPGGPSRGLSSFLECILSHLYSYLSRNATCTALSVEDKTIALS